MSREGIPDPMDPWMTHPEVMVLMVNRPTGSCHEYTVMATAAAAIARTHYLWVYGIYPLLGRDAYYPWLPQYRRLGIPHSWSTCDLLDPGSSITTDLLI